MSQVRAQQAGRRTKEDEYRAEAGDKEQGVPQHRQLLAERCHSGVADSPSAEICDVGGNERQQAHRNSGEGAAEEGPPEITRHPLTRSAWITPPTCSPVDAPAAA